jgi:hypothetical protein
MIAIVLHNLISFVSLLLKYILKFLIPFLLLAYFPTQRLSAQQVTFHQLPQDLQLYPRNSQGIASIPIAGRLNAGTKGTISVLVKKGKSPYQYAKTALKSSGEFALQVSILAELVEYQVDVFWQNGNDSLLLAHRESIVAGDVFLVSGQSNSYTGKEHPKVYKGKFARSFGKNPDYENYQRYNPADTIWSISNSPADVGLFASELQRLLIEKQKIPIAIINGGSGGSSMEYNLFRTNNPADLNTSSGKLYYRSQKAGVINHVKAFIYRQGENEASGNAPEWLANFKKHVELLKKEYPSIQKIYLPQINILHGDFSLQSIIREGQRTITKENKFIRGFATIGTKGYDGIHYNPEGYAQSATELYRLIESDLYAKESSPSIESPNIQRAYFAAKDKKKIILEFEKGQLLKIPSDTTVTDWLGNKRNLSLKNNFFFAPIAFPTASFLELSTLQVKENVLTLWLSTPPARDTLAYTPSFYNHRNGYQVAAPLLTNQNGMRAFAFDHLHIEPYDNYFDDDADGFVNAKDQCPNTSAGNPVDKNGCASDQRDSDSDGLSDKVDDCPFEKRLAIPEIVSINANTLGVSSIGTYQWFKDGVKMDKETKQQLTISESGTYAIEIKSLAGCFVPRSASKNVLILSNTQENHDVTIFPNPAQDFVDLKINHLKYPSIHLKLMDILGNVKWEKQNVQSNERIPTGFLPAGTYLLIFSGGIKPIKLIKQ